jgi:hypothetical protein
MQITEILLLTEWFINALQWSKGVRSNYELEKNSKILNFNGIQVFSLEVGYEASKLHNSIHYGLDSWT